MSLRTRRVVAFMAATQILTVAACGGGESAEPVPSEAESQDGGSPTQSDSSMQSGPESGPKGDGDAATDADAGAPFSFADVGKPCTDDSECVGGTCYSEHDYGYQGGFCTTDCSEDARLNFETDTSCGPNARCQIGGWNERVCMPACEENADCREGYRCAPFRKGSNVGVCYAGSDAVPPPLPPRDLGHACTKDDDCDQICMTEAAYALPGGSCSAECFQTSDCGSNAACAVFGEGAGEISRCIAHCAANADCNQFYYCNKDDPGFTYCWPGSYVGGRVFVGAGLTVTVQDAVGGSLTFTSSQEFELPNRFAKGTSFNVTASVQGNPAGVVCTVTDGEGSIGGDGVRYGGVSVVCGKQAVFTKPGTTQWTVPDGVTSVSVVVVGAGGRPNGPYGGGGGELCYANDLVVTPGSKLDVVVGDFSVPVSRNDSSFNGVVARGGWMSSGSGVAAGGTGGWGGTCFAGGKGGVNGSAGGAAGYSGVGGSGWGGNADLPATNGAGGGGGGGVGGNGDFHGVGGAVGLEGPGANGVQPGGNGSQADRWVPVAGGGGTSYDGPVVGYSGGVRIIWGAGRSYPNNAANQ